MNLEQRRANPVGIIDSLEAIHAMNRATEAAFEALFKAMSKPKEPESSPTLERLKEITAYKSGKVKSFALCELADKLKAYVDHHGREGVGCAECNCSGTVWEDPGDGEWGTCTQAIEVTCENCDGWGFILLEKEDII